MGELASIQFRATMAGFVGTVIDWYDFFLYGTASALVFPALFFPGLRGSNGLLASFGTFSVGFFARPIGGIFFGYLGDKIGRKKVLIITLSVMGLSTFLVGCLPSYSRIGIAAPILLTTLRFVQGLAVGGEWGGATLLSVEHSSKSRRGLAGSWVQAGLPIGLLLSTLVYQVCSGMRTEPFLAWGWRIPFLFGLALTGIGFWIRNHVTESPLYLASLESKKTAGNPLATAIESQFKQILIIIGARIAENASFYIFTVFVISFATNTLAINKATVLNCILFGSAIEFFTILGFGALSDRIGRKPIYLIGLCSLFLSAFPYFWLIESKNSSLLLLAITFSLAVAHAAMYAPQSAFFAELFKTSFRYSGASLGYQLAAPLAGGLAPIIATKLLTSADGSSMYVSIYLMAVAAISIIAVFLAKETFKSSIE